MKKYLNIILLFFILLFTTACTSKLVVKVDILDKSVLRDNPEILMNEIDNYYSRVSSDLETGKYDKIREDYATKMNKYFDYLHETYNLDVAVMKADNQKYMNALMDSVIKHFNNAVQTRNFSIKENNKEQKVDLLKKSLFDFKEGNRIFAQYNNAFKNTIEANYQKIVDKINETAQNQLKSMGIAASGDIKKTQIDDLTKEKATKSEIINSAKVVMDTISFTPIFNDILASMIVNADDGWKGTVNKNFSRTFLGNSDIAIILQPDGNYSIKGIRNDASKATQAIFTVTNIAIATLGKAYGVGFSPANGDTTQSYSNKTIQLENTLKKNRQLSTNAALKIIQSIIAEKNNLADDAKYQNSMAIIQATYSINKNNLNQ